jgi:calpain-15
MCACASLAEMPQLVERLFITKETNEEGLYRLKVCKNGEWQEVVVDDYFPCFPNGAPIFSKGNGNEMWVLLLEKMYSKIHGSYKNIVGGSPHEAMMDLTGCPTNSFSFADESV